MNISFILPVYALEKDAKLFIHCVKSIVNQFSENDELIIVDDGSDSFVKEYCISLQNKNIIFEQQHNMGVSVARNKGIQKSTKEWIVFIDADDYIPENGVNNIKSNLDTNYDVIVYDYLCDEGYNNLKYYSFFDYSKEMTKTRINLALLQAPNELYGSKAFLDIGVPWAKAYKRSYIIDNSYEFDTRLLRHQDNIFNMHVLNGTDKIKYVNKPVYIYRTEHFIKEDRKKTIQYKNMMAKLHYLYFEKSKDPMISMYRNINLMNSLMSDIFYYIMNRNDKTTHSGIKALSYNIYHDPVYKNIPKIKFPTKKMRMFALAYKYKMISALVFAIIFRTNCKNLWKKKKTTKQE